MTKQTHQFFTLFLFALFGMYTTTAMSIEKPAYEVLKSQDNIQIRRYQPVIIAQVSVDGVRDKAATAGFRLLADYIFGNNTAVKQSDQNQSSQTRSNQKIAMTAPVQQQKNNGMWQISFVMPSKYTLDTLPLPNNAQVSLMPVEAQTMVAIRFSGLAKPNNIAKHEQELSEYIEQNDLTVVGDPMYAFYDAPWVPAFFRRNEIMFKLDAAI